LIKWRIKLTLTSLKQDSTCVCPNYGN